MATLNQYNVNNTNGKLFFSLVENPVVEPLDGPLFVEHLMMRFPEETYSKSRDSHLYKFLTALVGDSGAGLLKKKSLFARLQFESAMLSFQGLDKLYSPLIGFDRLPSEKYSIDPKTAILTSEEWEAVKSADTSYRRRALGYLQATRQGGTLEGIKRAASAAIGRNVQVVENYHYVFDLGSDSPVGYEKVGRTNSVSEFIIRPHVSRNDINKTEFAVLNIKENAIGDFQFVYEGETSSVIFTANISADIIKNTLIGLDVFEIGDISVTRATTNSYIIRFNKNNLYVQRLTIVSETLTNTEIYLQQSAANDLFYVAKIGDPSADYYNAVISNSSSDMAQRPGATSYLDPFIQKNLDQLIQKVKPVSSIFSIAPSNERYVAVPANTVFASSERFSVNRFVNYSGFIKYDAALQGDESEEKNYAYTGKELPTVFTTIDSIIAYSQQAVTDPAYNTDAFYIGDKPVYKEYPSYHVGSFFDPVPKIYGFLKDVPADTVFSINNIVPSNNTNAIFVGAVTP